MSNRKPRSRSETPKSVVSTPGHFFDNPRKPKVFANLIDDDSNDSSLFGTPKGTPASTKSRSKRSHATRSATQKSRTFISLSKPKPSSSSSGKKSSTLDNYSDNTSASSDHDSDDASGINANIVDGHDNINSDVDEPNNLDKNENNSNSDDESHSTYSNGIPDQREKLSDLRASIMEADNFLPLVLPSSSTDIHVPSEYLMDAIAIYETLRHYRTILRLSPFRLEDFCVALQKNEQCGLLGEIHMALLKSLLREEDGNNTTFGPQDLMHSINISFMFMDGMSWPELVRSYLESDHCWEFQTALDAYNNCDNEYPYSDIKTRMIVLKTLSDMFLASNAVREEIVNEGHIQYDDHCRSCHKLGDLLCCETCPAVYHLNCVDPPLEEVPEDDWICNVCKAHKIKGVTDCVQEVEKHGGMCRQDPLGYDRYRRKWWFLCRRIIVEDEESHQVWYYSSTYHLTELLELLDPVKLERGLVRNIRYLHADIEKQMKMTEELTEEGGGPGAKSILAKEIGELKAIQDARYKAENPDEEEEDESKIINATDETQQADIPTAVSEKTDDDDNAKTADPDALRDVNDEPVHAADINSNESREGLDKNDDSTSEFLETFVTTSSNAPVAAVLPEKLQKAEVSAIDTTMETSLKEESSVKYVKEKDVNLDKPGEMDESDEFNKSVELNEEEELDESEELSEVEELNQSAGLDEEEELNDSEEMNEEGELNQFEELDDKEELNELEEKNEEDVLNESEELDDEEELNEVEEMNEEDELNESEEQDEGEEMNEEDELNESEEQDEGEEDDLNESEELDDEEGLNELEERNEEDELNESEEQDEGEELNELEEMNEEDELNESEELDDDEELNEVEERNEEDEISESEEQDEGEELNESEELNEFEEDLKELEGEKDLKELNESNELDGSEKLDELEDDLNELDEDNDSVEMNDSDDLDQSEELADESAELDANLDSFANYQLDGPGPMSPIGGGETTNGPSAVTSSSVTVEPMEVVHETTIETTPNNTVVETPANNTIVSDDNVEFSAEIELRTTGETDAPVEKDDDEETSEISMSNVHTSAASISQSIPNQSPSKLSIQPISEANKALLASTVKMLESAPSTLKQPNPQVSKMLQSQNKRFELVEVADKDNETPGGGKSKVFVIRLADLKAGGSKVLVTEQPAPISAKSAINSNPVLKTGPVNIQPRGSAPSKQPFTIVATPASAQNTPNRLPARQIQIRPTTKTIVLRPPGPGQRAELVRFDDESASKPASQSVSGTKSHSESIAGKVKQADEDWDPEEEDDKGDDDDNSIEDMKKRMITERITRSRTGHQRPKQFTDTLVSMSGSVKMISRTGLIKEHEQSMHSGPLTLPAGLAQLTAGQDSDEPPLIASSRVVKDKYLRPITMLNSYNSNDNARSGTTVRQVIMIPKKPIIVPPPPPPIDYKLGQECNYKKYVNQYTSNNLALNKPQHNEERDKRRHLSYKFSLTSASEFKWQGPQYGTREQNLTTLKQTIMHLENLLPNAFLHSNWSLHKLEWKKALVGCSTPKDFGQALTILESCMKPCLFSFAWSESLGHMKLNRVTAMEREMFKKSERERKKREDEEEVDKTNWVKNNKTRKHEIWKQRGEEYRLSGQGGWYWTSNYRRARYKPYQNMGLLAVARKLREPAESENNGEQDDNADAPSGSESKSTSKDDLDEEKKETADEKVDVLNNSDTKPKSAADLFQAVGKELDDARVKANRLARQQVDALDTEEEDVPDPDVDKMEKIVDDLSEKTEEETDQEESSCRKLRDDVIDISHSLRTRTPHYPKTSKPYSKLDGILKRRHTMHMNEVKQNSTISKLLEELAVLKEKIARGEVKKPEENDMKMDEEREEKLAVAKDDQSSKKSEISINSDSKSVAELPKSNEANEVDQKATEKSSTETENKSETEGKTEIASKSTSETSTKQTKSSIEGTGFGNSSSVIIMSCSESGATELKTSDSQEKVKETIDEDECNKSSTCLKPGIDSTEAMETDADVTKNVVEESNKDTEKMESSNEIDDSKHLNTKTTAPITQETIHTNNDKRSSEKLVVPKEGAVTGNGDATEDEKSKLTDNVTGTKDKTIVESTNAKTVPESSTEKKVENSSDSNKTEVLGDLKKENSDSKTDTAAKVASNAEQSKMSLEKAVKQLSLMSDEKVQRIRAMIKQERCTKEKVKLSNKLGLPKRKSKFKKGALPPLQRFKGLDKNLNILVFDSYELNRLARRGGFRESEGFNYNCKMANVNWPYQCPRPTVQRVWRYKAQGLRNLAAASLLLRMLWVSVKWDDMNAKPPIGGQRTQTTETQVITRQLLKRRDIGPWCVRSEYLIHKIVVPLGLTQTEQPKDKDYTPIRSGLRARKRPDSPKPAEASQLDVWVPETDLEMWEIRLFNDKVERQRLLHEAKMRKDLQKIDGATTTVIKTAADLKAHLEADMQKQRAAAAAKRLLDQAKGINRPHQVTTLMPSNLATRTSARRLLVKPSTNASSDAEKIASSLVENKSIVTSSSAPSTIKSDTISVKAMLASRKANQQQTSASKLITSPKLTSTTTITPGHVQLTVVASAPKDAVAIPGGLKVVKNTTGQLTVSGLSAGQHLVQAPDGRLQIVMLPVGTALPPGSLVTVRSNAAPAPPKPASAPLSALAPAPPRPHVSLIRPGTLLRQPLQKPQQPTMLIRTPLGLRPFTPGQPMEGPLSPTRMLIRPGMNVVSAGTPSMPTPIRSGATPAVAPQIIQQVLQRALLQNQNPELQAKLLAMQEKVGGRPAKINNLLSPADHDHDSTMEELGLDSIDPEDTVFRPYGESSSRKSKTLKEDRFKDVRKTKPQREERESREPRPKKIKRISESQAEKHSRALSGKLQTMLFKHKESLKKDILRKRALLDKALLADVSNELQQRLKQNRKMLKRCKTAATTSSSLHTDSTAHSTAHDQLSAAADLQQQSQLLGLNSVAEEKPRKKKQKLISTGLVDGNVVKTGGRGSASKLYCICRTPYDETQFYIGCDICSNWFHGECVNISEIDAKFIDTFVCEECKIQRDSRAEELYCLCRKPYNESRFYVGCDECQDWFHPECVGISKAEAETLDTYLCPSCSKSSSRFMVAFTNKEIDPKAVDLLKRLVRSLMTHKMAWPFLDPVDEREVPDYYTVIKEPMDLSTVERKLLTGEYQIVGDVTRDLNRIFENCRYYNPNDSHIFHCSETLEKFFFDKLKQLKPKIVAS